MKSPYDLAARKRAVILTLNEDLATQARSIGDNISAVVESLLGDLASKQRQREDAKAKAMRATIAARNSISDNVALLADEHSRLRWHSSTYSGLLKNIATAFLSL